MSFMEEIKKKINSQFIKNHELPGALYAIDTIEDDKLKVYSKKLDDALKDERVTNIAVSAPYGVGKSSVLLSYFKANRVKYNWYIVIYNWFIRAANSFKSKFIFSSNMINEKDIYQFVNLPNFFYEERDTESSSLQKEIVKQLLSPVSSHEYPYSKIKRIQDRSFFVDSILLIIFSLMTYGILNKFEIVPELESLRDRTATLFTDNFLFSIVSIIALVLFWGFLVQIFRRVKSIFSKSTFSVSSSNFSFQSNNVEINDEVETFNLYQEEIMYYFRKSKVKVVVFEDLDRFENPQIFQDLRELNININKRNGRVVFIYSLKDSVFNQIEDTVKIDQDIEDENQKNSEGKTNKEKKTYNPIDEADALLKSKFFDYIIPIFPVQDYENTGKSFIKELEHHFGTDQDFLNDESFKFFIEDLGIYIKDLRTIKLIINEFKVYYDSLKNIDELRVEKTDDIIQILSMVIYKNIYSADFEKITTNESILNGIFNYRSNVIQILTDKKVEQIDEQISEIEEGIEELNRSYIQDVKKILQGHYKQLWNDTFNLNYNSGSFYFVVEGETYNYEEGLDFYRRIIKLPRSTIIETRGRTRNNLTIDNVLNYNGEVINNLINYLDKNDVEPILREQTLLYHNLENLKMKRKNSYVDVINRTTGEIILELENLVENLSNEIIVDSKNLHHKKFKNAYNKFKKQDLLRFLIFNNYINDNYKTYISKVSYNLSHGGDKEVLKLIRSYNKDFNKDYNLESPKYVDYYLSKRPSSYYYAYSSDLLLYLSQFSNNEKKIKDILSNDMINNKYHLINNAVIKALKNNSLLLLIQYIWNISPKYMTGYLKESNIKTAYAINIIKSIFTNFYLFRSEKNNTELINFINVSLEYHPEKILDVLLEMNNEQIFIKNEFISKYRKYFVFKDIENINEDYYEMIFINGFYIPNDENFNIFKYYYNIENIFEDFYQILLKQSDELVIDYKAFFDYISSEYKDNAKESYFGFKKFIENVNGVSKDLENDYNNISTQHKRDKNKLYDYFSNINLAEIDVNKNREIIKLIDDDSKFSTEQLRELISRNRLYYNQEFWKQSIQSKILKEYIIMCMIIDQSAFQAAFEDLNVSLTLASKLEMIYLAEEEELVEMLINKQESGSGEELDKISESDFHIIINKVLNSNPTKPFLLMLLTKIPYEEVKNRVVGYILDNNDKLNFNSQELDTALDTTIFSKPYKNGTEYLDFKTYGVSKELINILEERDLAKIQNNECFSLKAALSKVVEIV